jgi:hypothetical protein
MVQVPRVTNPTIGKLYDLLVQEPEALLDDPEMMLAEEEVTPLWFLHPEVGPGVTEDTGLSFHLGKPSTLRGLFFFL